jgi:hypothetical protein
MNRVFNTRYSHNGDALKATIRGGGPTWSGQHYGYNGRLYIRVSQNYGVFFPKSGELFEYTDKVARIGWGHIVRPEFTAEEAILCRAEAYIYKNEIEKAVADLKIYDDSRKRIGGSYKDLTETEIESFYLKDTLKIWNQDLNTTLMSTDFVVSEQQKPYIDCVLHFRRIETLYDGYRWFDIKRYGIEITHTIGRDRIETLKWDDPRRAIQIPQEVMAAGMTPNPNNRLMHPNDAKNTKYKEF